MSLAQVRLACRGGAFPVLCIHRAHRLLVGTGDYQVAGLPIPKGGRFNMSNPKSKVEWDIYRAKQVRPSRKDFTVGGHRSRLVLLQLPGPADYGAPALPTPGGGRFSTANPKSQLDWVRYFAKDMPSPADYGAPKLPKPGTSIRRS